VYFGNVGTTNLKNAFDNSIYTDQGNTSSKCTVGMQFKEGYIGLLSQVKYFIKNIPSSARARYVDNLVFEGSNDGKTFKTLF
jgi:hypothetical protein